MVEVDRGLLPGTDMNQHVGNVHSPTRKFVARELSPSDCATLLLPLILSPDRRLYDRNGIVKRRVNLSVRAR